MSTDVEQRLKEIEDRDKAATAGPWKRKQYHVNTVTLRTSRNGDRTATVYDGDVHHDDQNDPDSKQQLVDDTDFIARARADVPFLLALVRKYRETLEDFKTNYDCDSDAHKYGTRCRVCAAQEALKFNPERPSHE